MKYFASGLLFDNDGVLVDSHSAAVEAWGLWASEFAPHVNWNDPANAGQRAEDLVRRWIASPDLFEQANDRINQLEQESAHATIALAGAVDIVAAQILVVVGALDAMAVGIGFDHGPNQGIGGRNFNLRQVVAQGWDVESGLNRSWHVRSLLKQRSISRVEA